MPKDNKAIYGSQQRWWRQLEKQKLHGEAREEREEGEIINEND